MKENKYALSLPQRLILVNQYKILKCLTDNVTEQQDYDNLITALENGYELHYQDCFEYMGDNDLTIEECREVLDILEMYRGIIYSYNALNLKNKLTTLKEEDVMFPGFDGNNEYKQLSYVRYFIVDLDRYSEIQDLNHTDNYNSHARRLDKYRKMLEKWNQFVQDRSQNQYLLSESQIRSLIETY